MNSTTIIIIVVVVITLALFIVFQLLKKQTLNKMLGLIQTGETDKFVELTNKSMTKLLFPRFNIEYLKLNAFILEGNKRKINDEFDLILGMKMNKAQKEDVTMKAFNYYVGMEDKHKTKEMIEIINTFTNERMKDEANITYDVFIQKKYNHIEELEERIKDMAEANRAIYEYILSVQYTNKGDDAKAKEYEELSKKHMEEPIEK